METVKRHARLVVPSDAAGRPLLDFICTRFSYHDRSGWEQQFRDGRLLINGTPALAGHLLTPGEQLEYLVPDIPEPNVNREVHVVFEDNQLLVLDKPPNLPCHPGGRFFQNTLWGILKSQRPGQTVSFINRLDRETSGIVLVAKDPESTRRCRAQFSERRVEKRYLVFVEGAFPSTLDAAGFLSPDTTCEVRKKRRFELGGPVLGGPKAFAASRQQQAQTPGEEREWAETHFRKVQESAGVTLIEARPATGRQHQIRATLCSLGYPVVGDKLYGVDPTIFLRFCTDAMTPEDRARLRLNRQALHAAGLRLRHPATNQFIQFDLPLPDDMQSLIVTPS